MANTIRIKRRASPGASGSPATLLNAELAFNEVDDTLYYGKGLSGGNATQVIAIGGQGAFVTATTEQTITGAKHFDTLSATTLSASNFTFSSSGAIANLNADYLDGQHGSWYQDWTNVTNKPDPEVTVALSGDATGTATQIVTDCISGAMTIGVTLANTAVSAGSYGSTTQIPTFTVDTKGRLTAAGTVDVATTLTVSSDAATGSVNLLNQVFSIKGTNGLSSTASGQIVTITSDSTPIASANTSVQRDGSNNFAANNLILSTGISATTADITVQAHAGTNGNVYLTPAGSGTVDVASKRITNVANPIGLDDAANKRYVDMSVQGLDPKQSVRAATVSAIELTGAPVIIDTITVTTGQRVLVKDQVIAIQNGIYLVSDGDWVRTLDGDTWDELVSAYLFVEEGFKNVDNGFLCTIDVTGGEVGVNDITWVQFNGAGQVIPGAGLTKIGNQIDVIGTTARITINPDSVDIAADYIGQNTIQFLGTVTAGTWQGSTVQTLYGGTGQTVFTPNGIIYGNNTSGLLVTVAGTWDAGNSIGQFLSVNSGGTPTWTNTIDCGSF
jgi:hypothetical protein